MKPSATLSDAAVDRLANDITSFALAALGLESVRGGVGVDSAMTLAAQTWNMFHGATVEVRRLGTRRHPHALFLVMTLRQPGGTTEYRRRVRVAAEQVPEGFLPGAARRASDG